MLSEGAFPCKWLCAMSMNVQDRLNEAIGDEIKKDFIGPDEFAGDDCPEENG